ncbi:MAG: SpoIIE family protein phosphatase, partial [Chloroflexota bacterium]|nr:SpoIIE family protein phosphatase [Chloroflexota bacterium]
RVAQLVRQQQMEARERERIAQELRVARLIQQTLLPKAIPAIPNWQIAAYYQPAREVGGDFYDFLSLPDGRVGIVVGDVTDKGVPAALVMATTRSILRGAAQRQSSPGEVLARVNELLHPDIPPNMFVTCLYAILDPATGYMLYANAGHDLPYRRHAGGAEELRARGMPLGLMPGMHYEEKEAVLAPGDLVVFYSDGLVEAHNPQRDMFGFPRLQELVAAYPARNGTTMIDYLMAELARFTGPDWEQEDDITMVTLERSASSPPTTQQAPEERPAGSTDQPPGGPETTWRTLGEWTLSSEPGNERLAMEQVAAAVQELNLPARRLERLKTAVAEATMNAMEHGNDYRPELPVSIRVLASEAAIAVHITDQGGNEPIPNPITPDLEAKLEGRQSARGWGLFLIKNLVDEMNVTSGTAQHTIELILHLEGDDHAGETP